MCITIGHSEVKDKTFIYVGDTKINDTVEHVLGYQNSIENLSMSPNAMIIPFPSDVEMGPENVIDTSDSPNFLETLGNLYRRTTKSLGVDSFAFNSRSITKGFVKTFKAGAYDVVLTQNISADGIQEVLKSVPENKRPTLSTQFIEDFNSLYPNWQIAICCFDGTIKSENMFWHYVPRNENLLFVPLLDSHDEKLPYIKKNEDRDNHGFIKYGSFNNNHYTSHNHLVLVGTTFGKLLAGDRSRYAGGKINVPDVLKGFVGGTDVIIDHEVTHGLNQDLWVSKTEFKGLRDYSFHYVNPEGSL